MTIVVRKSKEGGAAYNIAKALCPSYFNEKSLSLIKTEVDEHMLYGPYVDSIMRDFTRNWASCL